MEWVPDITGPAAGESTMTFTVPEGVTVTDLTVGETSKTFAETIYGTAEAAVTFKLTTAAGYTVTGVTADETPLTADESTGVYTTAMPTEGSTRAITITVSADLNPITAIALDKTSISEMKKDGTDTLTATPTIQDNTKDSTDSIEWVSSNPTVASVTPGANNTATVKALAIGQTSITATVEGKDVTSEACAVTVTGPDQAGDTYTFDANNLGTVDAGFVSSATTIKYDNKFNLVCDAKTKFDANSKTWDAATFGEEYSGSIRFNAGTTATNGIQFTTTQDNATVKIWYNTDKAANVSTSSAGCSATKGTEVTNSDTTKKTATVEYTLSGAGTYLVGDSAGSGSYIHKVVVTETAASEPTDVENALTALGTIEGVKVDDTTDPTKPAVSFAATSTDVQGTTITAGSSEGLVAFVKALLEAKINDAKITVDVTSATWHTEVAVDPGTGAQATPFTANDPMGTIDYEATLTGSDSSTSNITGSVTVTEGATMPEGITGAVTTANVGVYVEGTGDEADTLAPGYAISTQSVDVNAKTTTLTVSADVLVKHPQNTDAATEGWWLGFGIENPTQGTYVWKGGKDDTSTTEWPAAATRYIDVTDGENTTHYNTVYFNLGDTTNDVTYDATTGKYTGVIQQCSSAEGNEVLWTYNVTFDVTALRDADKTGAVGNTWTFENAKYTSLLSTNNSVYPSGNFEGLTFTNVTSENSDTVTNKPFAILGNGSTIAVPVTGPCAVKVGYYYQASGTVGVGEDTVAFSVNEDKHETATYYYTGADAGTVTVTGTGNSYIEKIEIVALPAIADVTATIITEANYAEYQQKYPTFFDIREDKDYALPWLIVEYNRLQAGNVTMSIKKDNADVTFGQGDASTNSTTYTFSADAANADAFSSWHMTNQSEHAIYGTGSHDWLDQTSPVGSYEITVTLGDTTETATVEYVGVESVTVKEKGDTADTPATSTTVVLRGDQPTTGELEATVLPATATEGTGVTWSVTETPRDAVADKVTVNATTGVVTVAADATVGDYTITATSVGYGANGKVTGTFTVTVAKPTVTSVTIKKGETEAGTTDTATYGTDSSITYTVAVDGTNLNDDEKAVTWASTDQAVATVDNNGVVTIHKAGTTTISATSNTTTTVKDEVTLTVSKGTPTLSISASPNAIGAAENNTVTVTVTQTPADLEGVTVTCTYGTNQNVTGTQGTGADANKWTFTMPANDSATDQVTYSFQASVAESDNWSAAQSAAATVTQNVQGAVTISVTSPTDDAGKTKELTSGDKLEMEVAATVDNDKTLTYQWSKRTGESAAAVIDGATSAKYEIAAAKTTDAGTYICTISYADAPEEFVPTTVEFTVSVAAKASTASFRALTEAEYALFDWTGIPTLANLTATYTADATTPTTIKVTGTIPYTEGFTGFNSTVVAEQEGNYIAFALLAPAETITNGTVVLVKGQGGTEDKTETVSGTADDPAGLLLLIRVRDLETQATNPHQFTVDWDGEGAEYTAQTYTLDFSEAELAAKTIAVERVTVAGPEGSETAAEVTLGETEQTIQLSATVAPETATVNTVTWRVTGPTVAEGEAAASGVTVSENGLVTIATDATVGAWTVTATSAEEVAEGQTAKSGTYTITVKAAEIVPPEPTTTKMGWAVSGDQVGPCTTDTKVAELPGVEMWWHAQTQYVYDIKTPADLGNNVETDVGFVQGDGNPSEKTGQSLPTDNAYAYWKATQDGTLSVDFVILGAKVTFIRDVAPDGTLTTPTYPENVGETTSATKAGIHTFTVDAKAGHSYYIWLNGSKAGNISFTFETELAEGQTAPAAVNMETLQTALTNGSWDVYTTDVMAGTAYSALVARKLAWKTVSTATELGEAKNHVIVSAPANGAFDNETAPTKFTFDVTLTDVVDSTKTVTLTGLTLNIVEPPETYAVSVATGIENGTVSVSVASAAANDEVTVTATPADGYQLGAITVTAADGTSVTVTDGKFTMPAQAVTVSATFTAQPAGEITTTYTLDVLDFQLTEYGTDLKRQELTETELDAVEKTGQYFNIFGTVDKRVKTAVAEGTTTPSTAEFFELKRASDSGFTFTVTGTAVVTIGYSSDKSDGSHISSLTVVDANGTAQANKDGATISSTTSGTSVDVVYELAAGTYTIKGTVDADETNTDANARVYGIKVVETTTEQPPVVDKSLTAITATPETVTITGTASTTVTVGVEPADTTDTVKILTQPDATLATAALSADGKTLTITGVAKGTTSVVLSGTTAESVTKTVAITVNEEGGEPPVVEPQDMTVTAAGFTGAYDGQAHGITVTVTEPATDATVTYSATADGTYAAEPITATNVADSKVVYFKVTAEGYKDYTGSAAIAIRKADVTLGVTAAPTTVHSATEADRVVTFTVTGLETGAKYDITCDKAVTVTEDKVTLPDATETYTFTATYAGDDNHNAASASVKVYATKSDEIDKSALRMAIDAASAKLEGVTAAADGTTVPKGELWATQEDIDALTAAIATAQAEVDSTESTDESVAAAVAALNTAADGFVPAEGTKTADKSALTQAITDAQAALDKAAKTEDGSTVSTSATWISPVDEATLEAAIAQAQEVADNADATQADVDAAVAALADAVKLIQKGTKADTTPSRPSSGGGSTSVSTGSTTTKTLPDGTKVVTTTTNDGDVSAKITLGRGVDSTTVSVTVPTADSGLVPVLVKADGTEEIIRDSAVIDDQVVFTVDADSNVKIVNNAKEFVDVPGHWAEPEVDFVSARELFNGVDATHFAPDATMTRGMMATVLFRLDGETKAETSNDFSDVVAGEWYADAVDWAAEASIINGYTDGSFGPTQSITRQELVVMIYRYAGQPAVDDEANMNGFTDAGSVADWAETAMRWAIQSGIIKGRGDGTLDPQGNATRAEVSAVLARYVALNKQ